LGNSPSVKYIISPEPEIPTMFKFKADTTLFDGPVLKQVKEVDTVPPKARNPSVLTLTSVKSSPK
jgi:hypothetical protein